MKERLQLSLRILREPLLYCLVGAFPGALAGAPLTGALAGAGVWLLWTLLQQLRLAWWLQRGATGSPPQSAGLWGTLFAALPRPAGRPASPREAEPWRELFQNFGSGVILLDPEGRIDWCNWAAARLPGVHLSQDRGRHLSGLLRTPELLQFLQDMPTQTALECPAPGDPSRRLRFSGARLPEGRSVVFVQDATQQHRLEQMRRDFIANVSHELRTPLTVIVGCLELMDEALPPEKTRAMVDDMRHQAGRMSSLVQSLLRLARLESLTEPAGREPIPLRALLEEACDSMKIEAGPDRRLELRCPEELRLLGERGELHSIFINLLDNAVRHTDAQTGVIAIEVQNGTDGVRVRVRDNGDGIERRHLPRLTERFYRADAGRDSSQAGAGLGLAIVKHALERHQGELQIHSWPGQGSEFICRFPPERSA